MIGLSSLICNWIGKSINRLHINHRKQKILLTPLIYICLQTPLTLFNYIFLPIENIHLLINNNTDQYRPIILIMRNLMKKPLYLFSVQKFNPQKDYYKSLNLSQKATPPEIKQAFKNLAKKYHPDVNHGNQAMFKEINEAYQVLQSQQIKKEYDQSRKGNNTSSHTNETHRQNQRDPSYQNQHQKQRFYYDPNNPQKLREYLRKQNQEIMKKYTKRQQYTNFGNAYSAHDQFTSQVLKKKAQVYRQKTRVTHQSVKKQQQLTRLNRQQRDQAERQERIAQLKRQMQQKYNTAVHNTQKMVSGAKKMGDFIKNIFKNK